MMLILSLHEHGIYFHLLESSSVSLVFCDFSEFRPFTSLVKFIPWYCIIFYGVVNDIIFLVSLSDSSLLVCKNATDFWIFILYPATLLNPFISSSSFGVES